MTDPGPARRTFLGAVGGAAAIWLTAPWSEVLATGTEAARPSGAPFLVFTPAEASEIEAMAAQIVPTDETPGAREARVVVFMDRALATFASQSRPVVTAGLAQLPRDVAAVRPGARSFASLAGPDQIAVLTALERARSPFFEWVRTGTITGFLANPSYGGNAGKVGWKLIGFEDRFSWAPPYGYYDRP